MEDNGIKKELIVQIQTIAAQNGVEKVILFGSRARGDHNKTSDRSCRFGRKHRKVCSGYRRRHCYIIGV